MIFHHIIEIFSSFLILIFIYFNIFIITIITITVMENRNKCVLGQFAYAVKQILELLLYGKDKESDA